MSLSPEELAVISSQITSAMKAASPAAPGPISFAALPAPAMLPTSAFGAAPVWGAPAPQGVPQPTGVSFRVTLPLPDGSEIPADITFGPEYANPAAMQNLAGQLLAAGWPVKVYRPRPQFGGGGGWNGGGGGSNFGGGRRFGGRY